MQQLCILKLKKKQMFNDFYTASSKSTTGLLIVKKLVKNSCFLKLNLG